MIQKPSRSGIWIHSSLSLYQTEPEKWRCVNDLRRKGPSVKFKEESSQSHCMQASLGRAQLIQRNPEERQLFPGGRSEMRPLTRTITTPVTAWRQGQCWICTPKTVHCSWDTSTEGKETRTRPEALQWCGWNGETEVVKCCINDCDLTCTWGVLQLPSLSSKCTPRCYRARRGGGSR